MPRFNRWMADTISPYLGPSVLELGAGIGNLSQHLCRLRKRYVLTDIDDQHLARLRMRFENRPWLEIHSCNLESDKDFAAFAGQMDSIVCLNVLEHVEDDLSGLRNIYSALRPGGNAIVLVPQDQHIYGTLDEVLGHFRRYSKQELKARMEQAGFHVSRILDFNRAARPGWYFNGKLLKKSSFSRFQVAVFERLIWLWRAVDHWLPWRAISIIAIAAKPGESLLELPQDATTADRVLSRAIPS